jgi:hypothetical protein
VYRPDQGDAGFHQLFGEFPPELSKWWTEYVRDQLSSFASVHCTDVARG